MAKWLPITSPSGISGSSDTAERAADGRGPDEAADGVLQYGQIDQFAFRGLLQEEHSGGVCVGVVHTGHWSQPVSKSSPQFVQTKSDMMDSKL